MRRQAHWAALIGLGLVTHFWLATDVSGQAASGEATADSTWLSYDSTSKTVTFRLVAGVTGAKSPFNFDGFTVGEATLIIPAGATVVMPFVNNDGTPHSAIVASGTEPIPNMAGDPAIPRAYSRNATQGLAQGQKDTIRFKAEPSGSYRITCGVPGHALSGMWIWLEVSREVSVPTLKRGPS
jgi:sulfocyanin